MDGNRPGPWRQELNDFARAFSGAFLFGIPLLFTMEMWWIGAYAELWKLLVFLVLAFVANLGLTYFAGFRQGEHSIGQTVNQAVDAVAVGAVASTIVLLVLNRISLSESLDSVLGKIVIQTVPLSIGASVANAVFGAGGNGRAGGAGQEHRHGHWWATLNDLGATIAGGIFVGFAIAPTEEIPLLAAEVGYFHQLALVGLSLALTYVIVFVSGFDPQQRRPEPWGLFQRPSTETIMAYLISLIVALVALYLFDRVQVGDPLSSIIVQVLVLGLPTSIGGAAGRVVI